MKGYVKNIVFRNEENGYTVLSLVVDGEETTVVGALAAADAGDVIEAEGALTTHAVYGEQFKATTYRVLMPDGAQQTERYLASGAIKGVGAALAARIVKRFGDDTFRVMEEEPERLAEVKGISLKKAREIALVVQEKKGARDALLFLQGYGVGGTLAARIVKRYGDEVYAVIKTNPYRLAEDIEGVGFKTADEIARASGMTASNEYRLQSGLYYTLTRAAQEGDCYLPAGILIEETCALLEIDRDDEALQNALVQLQMDGKTVCVLPDEDAAPSQTIDPNAKIYAAPLYHEERACASLLQQLHRAGRKHNASRMDDEDADALIARIEDRNGVTLDDLQRRAVVESMRGGVVIVTGGPGTGKTTTINTILRCYEAMGLEVLLAAPTGRAARRMSEATGYEARTIHRLLEVNGAPETEGFQRATFERNAEHPLEADAVILDEMSMVDIRLFSSVLKATPMGARLVLVGDANQLPSVGPGQALRDLIASAQFPTIVLNKIFRQEAASDIVINAHRIRRGEAIALDNSAKDFFFLKRDDPQVIMKHIVELARDKLPPYLNVDQSQIQVLTPMKKGDLGTAALNRALQSQLNPKERHKRERDFGEKTLREGDKVMQIKNNYQIAWEVVGKYNIVTERGTGVFNGDLGVVREINEAGGYLVVEFDEGRRVSYPFADASELELAYALTIHKSQGSEYPAVILPLMGGPRPLMNRNLLYTAVTRAKSLVVILGSEQAVARMIDNAEQTRRYTGLEAALAEFA